MRWFGWFRRAGRGEPPTGDWRRSWALAVEAPDAARARTLRDSLRDIAGAGVEDDAFEIEREMMDGLDAVVELSQTLQREGPPTVATGHRAVGAETCHFSAPASLPDDPGQPSGTLLLTGARMVFVGGARAITVPWHAVAQCLHQDRDLVLVRRDGRDALRIRCNTFADTLRAAALARHLAGPRRV